MTDKKSDFKTAMKILLDDEKQSRSPLSAEEVYALHEKELSIDEDAGLLERLILDKEAVKSLVELDSIPNGSYPQLPEEERESSWREFRQKLPKEDSAPDPETPKPAASVTVPRIYRLVAGLAAALLIATVGLAAWVVSLKQGYPGLVAPTMDAATFDVYPDQVRGSQEEIRLTQGVQTIRFHLAPSWRDYSLYRIEIRDPSGKLVLSINGKPDKDQALTLILTPQYFSEPGRRQAMVFGLDGEKTTRLKGFTLTTPGD